MPTVGPGASVSVSADTMGTRPKWMKWTATGTAGGSAELPSGHRRLVKLNGTTRGTEDYYVTPQTLGSTDASWRATIYAPDGSYIYADGLQGFPTIGTPAVRLQADAPAKAVITIPADRHGGILAPSFTGWNDGHAGAVGRGMEVTVEYRRPDGTMVLVFRGMIYQIMSGETVQLIAYDRLMDLYQYSDQYQSSKGYSEETLALTATTAIDYQYTAAETPGAIVSAAVKSELLIDSLSYADTTASFQYTTTICHSLPSYGRVSPKQGDTINRVQIKYHKPTAGTGKATLYLARIIDNEVKVLAYAGSAPISTSGSAIKTLSWGVNWTISYPPSQIYIMIQYHVGGNYPGAEPVGSTTSRTVSQYLRYNSTTDHYIGNTSLSSWTAGLPLGSPYFEPAVKYINTDQIPVANVGISGNTLSVPLADVTTPASDCSSTISAAYEMAVAYFVLGGMDLKTAVTELLRAAGLVPDIPGTALPGSTTFYTSSTYDYLTCVQELIRGGNCGIRASIAEPGKIEVRPRDTIDGTPVASFTTAPDGSGERSITSHNLTAHWMAEKATQAILAENATTSGLPLAIETDDRLMDGSIAEALQSPLRGITADSSMGTHLLLATAAGGKMVQLHTNIYEGEMVLVGYRSDIWNLDGASAGGKPITIKVPEYGANGTAIPTEVEFSGGCTRVSLNNIRTADRSEIARSMGLTGDAISNTARTLPDTSFIFARYDDYTTQETGIAEDSVTLVEFLQDGGTVLASQNDAGYLKTVSDAAGYLHVCAVMPSSPGGYATNDPIAAVRFTMGGTTRTAVLDNPKYAVGGQAIHCDIRMREA